MIVFAKSKTRLVGELFLSEITVIFAHEVFI